MEHVFFYFLGCLRKFSLLVGTNRSKMPSRGQESLFHGLVYYRLQALAIRHISETPPCRGGIHT